MLNLRSVTSYQSAPFLQRNSPCANIHRQAIHLPLAKPDTFHPRFSGSDDAPITYKRGLEGVTMGFTRISNVDPDSASLTYHGYDIRDRVEKSTFEETGYLLLYGKLPNRDELTRFEAQLVEERPISEKLIKTIRAFLKEAHPMDRLKAAVCELALEEDSKRLNDNTPEANSQKALQRVFIPATGLAAEPFPPFSPWRAPLAGQPM